MTRKPKRAARAKPMAKPKSGMPSPGTAVIVTREALPTVDDATAILEPFFEANPYSTLEAVIGDPDALKIVRPWGDASVALNIEENFADVAAVLNEIILPERFSGIWHPDVRKLEVIWTAYKLPPIWEEIYGRKFRFEHKGVEHLCEFGISSDRLVTLAGHFSPETISDTGHRNMPSFRALATSKKKGMDAPHLDQPRSFWISNIDWNEEGVINLASHLNFFMRYFDGLSPTVLIHPPQDKPFTPKKTRYIRGKFPREISSRKLDENLLSFWAFADQGNPMLRMLLYYRIIEYAAVHFIDDSIREELKKLIVSPDLKDDLIRSVETMVGAMSASKLSDAQRLQSVMKHCVNPDLLWRDIKANIAFFSKDTVFDGGFVIKALVGANETEAGFRNRGVENVADAFRKIRNALSHGKDQETAGVIRPTLKNFGLFNPWVHLIATAAGEVVIYKDAT